MASDRRQIGIGLMGLGVVGSGVARILAEKADVYARQIGYPLVLRRVLVRDPAKERGFAIDRALLSTNARDLLDDPDIELVIEVMGGEQPAYEFLREALAAGKFVVTANKEVMAKHGAELLALARERNVDLLYEASVGGGIPIIAPLKRDLLANDIVGLTAIINGTTNFILTSMSHGGGTYGDAPASVAPRRAEADGGATTSMSRGGDGYGDALARAQALGYAEADPTNDVEGLDAAYKLAILATLAFHVDVRPGDVYCEGITRLAERDFVYARELGYAIKLLAIARKEGDRVQVRVHPTLVANNELLARVDGVLNAVEIEGDLMSRVLFQGPGAGALPTTSAVVADALDAAVSISNEVYWPYSSRREAGLRVMPMEDVRSRFYLRIRAEDRPGVLAQVAHALGERAISIAAVIQKEAAHDGGAQIVITTHEARERDLQEALAEIHLLDAVGDVEQVLRVKP